jgi:hypothetical protein
LRMSRPKMPRFSSINRYRPRKARFRKNRSSITTGAKLLLPSSHRFVALASQQWNAELLDGSTGRQGDVCPCIQE